MKPDTKGRGETREVPRRRRHRGSGIKKQPPVADRAERAEVNPPEMPLSLRSLLQEVADRAKVELASSGRIAAKAHFVYGDEPGSKMVSVALSFRSEQQKDALYKRIREKAAEEGARTIVVVLNDRPGHLTLSAVTAEARIGASVRYLFDGKSKTVTRWEMQWQNESTAR